VSIVKHNKLQETNKNPTHIRIANKFEALWHAVTKGNA
jgi:hypothetical protein